MSTAYRRSHTIIQSFQAKALRKRPLAVKIADRLTQYFGSVEFLIANIIVFVFWILINSGALPLVPIFDPYPYVLLITIVSLEAIILTTIVLISQNRENQISTLRDELQLQVELIAEKEITKLMRLVVKIAEKQGIKITDNELKDMVDDLDTGYIEKKLTAQLQDKGMNLIPRINNKLKQI